MKSFLMKEFSYAPTLLFVRVSLQVGFTKAPFLATSHTATRGQCQTVAGARHSNVRLPKNLGVRGAR